MKRKFFATILCLLMMATLLPAGIMASEVTTGENLLVNGDFEEVSASTTSQPAGWTIVNNGDSQQSLVTNAEGSKVAFSGNNAHQMVGDSGNKHSYIYQKVNGLENGKRYIVEGYLHMPNPTKTFRIYLGQNGPDGSSKGGFGFITGEMQTSCYRKITFLLNYTSDMGDLYLTIRLASSATIYLDKFAVYETNNITKSGDGFDRLKLDGTLEISDWLQTTAIDTSVALPTIIDTTEGYENTCLKVVNDATSSYTTYPLDIELSKTPTSATMLKVHYRIKLLSDTTLNAEQTLTVRVVDMLTGASNYLGCVIPKEKRNQWVNIELLTPAFSSFWFMNHASLDYLLDEVTCVEFDKSSIAGENVLTTCEKEIKSEGNVVAKIQGVVSEPLTGCTSTETVHPYLYFISNSTAGEKVQSLFAVYKNVGTKKQLLGVEIEELSSKSNIPAISKKKIDLSVYEMDTTAGETYTVEVYLWDASELTPLVKKTTNVITAAAEI